MRDEEYRIQCALAKYIVAQYPYVEFRSDMGGIRLPTGLAVKAKKANGGRKSWPDLFLAEPSADGQHGLFIEIKKNKLEVYKKNGEMRKDAHICKQNEKLKSLRNKGYSAKFGMGLEHCKEIIDNYLRG